MRLNPPASSAGPRFTASSVRPAIRHRARAYRARFRPRKTTRELYNATDGIGGRQYLGHVLQYGLTGSIEVGGTAYNGNMPARGALTNQQIADAELRVDSLW